MVRSKIKEDNLEIDLLSVTKYLDRESDQGETEKVERWISLSEENNLEFSRLKKAWELASFSAGLNVWNSQKRKEEFLKKIIGNQPAERNKMVTYVSGKRRIMRGLFKYAAVLIILAGIAGVIFVSLHKEPEKQTFTSISASRGSKTEMILSDGSRVLLNAGSSISYSSRYNKSDRDLFLEGEGYFEVIKKHGRPFRVYAGELVVQATGTAFNIKAYPEDNVIETTLVEGSVTVEVEENPENKISLEPNEQVNYFKRVSGSSDKRNFLIMKGINHELNTSWINDQLIISNETLESLAVKLGRKYDVTFHFEENSLKELRYTGVLNNETIEQILEILKISSPLDYRISKREIWLLHD